MRHKGNEATRQRGIEASRHKGITTYQGSYAFTILAPCCLVAFMPHCLPLKATFNNTETALYLILVQNPCYAHQCCPKA